MWNTRGAEQLGISLLTGTQGQSLYGKKSWVLHRMGVSADSRSFRCKPKFQTEY